MNSTSQAAQDRLVFLEQRWWGAFIGLVYVALAALPLLLAIYLGARAGSAFGADLRALGKVCALIGIAILALQFVLAARLRWIERPFGLDAILRFHKGLAVLALLLLVVHPLLIALSGPGLALLVNLDLPWHIWLGKLALVLVVVQVAVSLLWRQFRLTFERWRLLHNQAPLVFAIAFTHSRFAGSDLRHAPMQTMWWAMLAMAAAVYGYCKVIAPAIARRSAYRVVEVRRETPNVWTLLMEPPRGRSRFAYRPGQFHFITLWRGERGLPVQEHHFTISSSPTQPALASTIKQSGDFTATIGQTQPGDRASIQGPFGRFSYVFRPRERDFVFIAGGIGITPLMSNLRHMRDTRADVNVLLLYGSRTEADIVFRDELAHIAAGDRPRLRVNHILSEPGDGWRGETGYVDRQRIERLVGEGLARKTYYVCCPPPMARKVIGALRALGVPRRRIAYERFWL